MPVRFWRLRLNSAFLSPSSSIQHRTRAPNNPRRPAIISQPVIGVPRHRVDNPEHGEVNLSGRIKDLGVGIVNPCREVNNLASREVNPRCEFNVLSWKDINAPGSDYTETTEAGEERPRVKSARGRAVFPFPSANGHLRPNGWKTTK